MQKRWFKAHSFTAPSRVLQTFVMMALQGSLPPAQVLLPTGHAKIFILEKKILEKSELKLIFKSVENGD